MGSSPSPAGKNVLPLLLTLGVVSLPAWLNLDALRFRAADPFNVPGLLATVFLLALFQERAMEVFVTTWRGPNAEALEQLRDASAAALARLAASLPPAAPPEIAAKTMRFEDADSRLQVYRSETRRMALWTGLILGALISAAGFRTLEALATPEALKALGQQQRGFLEVVDVLLTGGLIGGGSEGIHKLAMVYADFMDSTSKRMKAA
jgi:hypothetical protein